MIGTNAGRPDLSRLARCYEAVLVTYRSALVAHLRQVFTTRFGAAAAQQVALTLGERWNELQATADRNTAAGLRERTDPFDSLEIPDFSRLVDNYFDTVHPRGAALGVKDSVMRRIRMIKEERDVFLSHPAGPDVGQSTAVAIMDAVHQVLRAFDLKEDQAKVRRLIDEVFGVERSTPAVEDFRALYGRSPGIEAFLKPLMRFFQELADEMADQDRENWVVLAPGESLLDYAQHWNTAPENVAFAIQDWLFEGWGGRSTINRTMLELDEPFEA